MVKLACTIALALMACGGTQRGTSASVALEASCAPELRWNGSACVSDGEAANELAQAREHLAAFEVDSALALLQGRQAKGPYGHQLLVTLHEQLGIAYSYLKKEEQALESFQTLLALDPGHLLSYTLSPQATFLFERARKSGKAQAPARVDVSWPQGLKESDPVPLSIEVVSDPLAMLHSMALYVRESEQEKFRRVQVALPRAGEVSRVVLPAARTKRDSVLHLYGSAYDKDGNEVLLWFNREQPRELPLGYVAPSPWYRKWWVWAAIGGTAAIGTGATVYLLGLEPADTIGGGFTLGG